MAAQPEDYFQEVGTPGSATYMTAPGYASGATTINVQSTAGFSSGTGVIFAVDTTTTVNGVETQAPGSYCVFEGKVASSTSLSGVSLLYGTPQNYPAGATTRVYITVSSQWVKRLVEGLLVSHTQLGTLKDGVVGTANIASNAVNSSKIDFGGAGAGIWWEELGRTTLSSASDTLGVASFAPKKFLKVYANIIPNGSINTQLRFNNDSGSNYSMNFSTDYAGTPSQLLNQNIVELEGGSGARQQFCQMDILNIATQAKLCIQTLVHDNATSSAGTAPLRFDNVFKWSNTSNQITRIDILNLGTGSTGDFAAGSEIVILGHN